jgi:LIM domain
MIDRERDPPPRRFPESKPNRGDDILGAQFDLSSIGAPHSYNGPYGAITAPRANARSGSPPRQPPAPQFQQRPPPPQDNRRPPPPMQRNPYDNPRNNEPPYPPRQQQPPPPRPTYTDDFNYARPPSRPTTPSRPPEVHGQPPPRIMAAPDPRQRFPTTDRPSTRQENEHRMRGPEPFQERRMPPEQRQIDAPPNGMHQPLPRRQDAREQQYENPYLTNGPVDREEMPLSPSRRNHNPSPSKSPQSNRSLDPPVEESELWRQIRNQAQQEKSRSISSSRSSNSDRSASNRSEATIPSSIASPITPTKVATLPTLHTDHSAKQSLDLPSLYTRGNSEVSKSVCRACNEPIQGRSLASRDGKLTGRYHRRCFCCATCQKPFETTSFYVFQDRPYCKQHYHELNHSTCSTCGEGVEGQCLQLEDSTIRHPSCFTCTVALSFTGN